MKASEAELLRKLVSTVRALAWRVEELAQASPQYWADKTVTRELDYLESCIQTMQVEAEQ